MATLITILLIALFCGAMLLLDRMLCGYVKMMSNSKKRSDERNRTFHSALRPGGVVLLVLFQMCGLVRKNLKEKCLQDCLF